LTPARQHVTRHPGNSAECHAGRDHRSNQAIAAPAAEAPDGYQPEPAPRWHQLTAGGRAEPIARLRAWVEQVYRPGYGHLAASLAPCWEAHDLCLYGLDIAASLWSVLYLQPLRSPGLVSAQAEYQARILPAIAAQLLAETTSCVHDHAARMQAPAYAQRLP
jgi:hypothetical protein